MRRGIFKKLRQEAAMQRQALRDKRGDKGQLEKLEKEGHGHCKEAKRLRAKLNDSMNI